MFFKKSANDAKNILITGGAGFIGSHLAEFLLKSNAHIICVDNFTNSSPANIEHLLSNSNFELIKQDITAPLDLESFKELERFKVKFLGVQEIYHLAAPTSAKNFDKYKIATLDANALGMKNILELAVKYKAKFLLASSAVVYGPRPADNSRFAEDNWGSVNLLSPRACYDEGKRFAETMVATYEQVHGIDGKIARIFRTYGPRLKLFDGQMISDFITDALDGNNLVIYGNESFSTTLCFVSDIVDGLVKLMEAPAGVGPVNLGGDEDIMLAEVAQKIIELTGSKSKAVFEKPLLFMSQLGIPSLAKARDALGWVPLVRLENGLKKSIEYAIAHKEILNAGKL